MMFAQAPPEELLRGLQQAAETDASDSSDSASDEEIVARLRASGPTLAEVRNDSNSNTIAQYPSHCHCDVISDARRPLIIDACTPGIRAVDAND